MAAGRASRGSQRRVPVRSWSLNPARLPETPGEAPGARGVKDPAARTLECRKVQPSGALGRARGLRGAKPGRSDPPAPPGPARGALTFPGASGGVCCFLRTPAGEP